MVGTSGGLGSPHEGHGRLRHDDDVRDGFAFIAPPKSRVNDRPNDHLYAVKNPTALLRCDTIDVKPLTGRARLTAKEPRYIELFWMYALPLSPLTTGNETVSNVTWDLVLRHRISRTARYV
jgi:hypothetical protein